MQKGQLKYLTNFSKIILSLLIVVGVSFIMLFFGSILCYFIFDINILSDTTSLNINSENVNMQALKFYQGIYSIGMFVVPPFVIAYYLSLNVSKYLNFRNVKISKLILAVSLIIVSIPAVNLIANLNSQNTPTLLFERCRSMDEELGRQGSNTYKKVFANG